MHAASCLSTADYFDYKSDALVFDAWNLRALEPICCKGSYIRECFNAASDIGKWEFTMSELWSSLRICCPCRWWADSHALQIMYPGTHCVYDVSARCFLQSKGHMTSKLWMWQSSCGHHMVRLGNNASFLSCNWGEALQSVIREEVCWAIRGWAVWRSQDVLPAALHSGVVRGTAVTQMQQLASILADNFYACVLWSISIDDLSACSLQWLLSCIKA